MRRRRVPWLAFSLILAIGAFVAWWFATRVQVRTTQVAGPKAHVRMINGVELPDTATDIILIEKTTRQLFAESDKEIEAQFAIHEQGFREWAEANGWEVVEVRVCVVTPSIEGGNGPLPSASITNGLEATNISRGVSGSYLAIYDRTKQRDHYTFQSRRLEEN